MFKKYIIGFGRINSYLIREIIFKLSSYLGFTYIYDGNLTTNIIYYS